MRKIISAFAFVLIVGLSYAQNLVPNPSFEIFDTCPGGLNEVYRLQSWGSYGNSPDYYNQCAATSTLASVPYNAFGYQYAATGNAYCGLYTYQATPYTEYIGSRLIDSLQIGQTYFVSFKVNVCNNPGINCGANKVGILFSTVSYSSSSLPPINNFAHVYATNIISDTLNWVRVTGTFVADSSYKYIIVGNFFDNSNTSVAGNCTLVYFYIDDVCVATDSLRCNSFNEKVEDINQHFQIEVYPNPNSGIFTLRYNSSLQVEEAKIYDIHGTLLKFFYKQIDDREISFELLNASKGIYYLRLLLSDQTVLNKLIFITN